MLTDEQREKFDDMIQISCYYDTWLSQDLFDENVIRPDDNTNYYQLNPEFGMTKEFVSFGNNINYKKLVYKSFKDICEICNRVGGDYSFDPCLDQFNEDPIGYVKDFFDSANYSDENIDVMKDYLITPVAIFSTHGYSQGDYQEYLVFGEKEIENEETTKEYVDHLFWDAPIHCSIMIDNEEFFVEGCDEYDYDKEKYVDELVDQLKADFMDIESLREYLLEKFPDVPNYD